MPMISGGNVIAPGVYPQTGPDNKVRITWIENAVPTDALVAGSTGRTPANGELACNVTNGNMYERQAGVWTRIDTL
jgi:hypothetical protein